MRREVVIVARIAGCRPTARSGTACGSVSPGRGSWNRSVPRPPAGVDGRAPSGSSTGPPCRAPLALLSAAWELVQIDRARPMRLEYALMKLASASARHGVVVEVLVHVLVQHGESFVYAPVPVPPGSSRSSIPASSSTAPPGQPRAARPPRGTRESPHLSARQDPIRGGGRWIR